jgi:hypothetical protein
MKLDFVKIKLQVPDGVPATREVRSGRAPEGQGGRRPAHGTLPVVQPTITRPCCQLCDCRGMLLTTSPLTRPTTPHTRICVAFGGG